MGQNPPYSLKTSAVNLDASYHIGIACIQLLEVLVLGSGEAVHRLGGLAGTT